MAGRPAGELVAAGTRYGRLVVEHDDGICFTVRCDCGRKKVVKRGNVIHGHSKSCGCYRKEKTQKTGQANKGKTKARQGPQVIYDKPQF